MPKSSGPTSGAQTDPAVEPDQVVAAADAEQDEPQRSPYEIVRVRDEKNGVELSMTRVAAAGAMFTVVDGKTATDDYGRPLPPKPITDKAGASASQEA